MPAYAMLLPVVFETAMLILFSTSWPFAIAKTWRAKRADGKSIIFLVFLMAGYACGVTSKLLHAYAVGMSVEPVTWLYAFNGLLVATDLILVVRFSRRPGAPAATRST